ncbi:hypothetical protein PTSG_07648 [Salpingoeca rosetta]|uniref:Fatty acid desaturase domain-containing protein n=1 Tax=Salpingoeca rosetta (strain ATCC 50818 / BSB-021) TaxID=946362 RepID=F2UHD2_SALR5|nr:uncharacterized protein PTSG_07648 [Salpingoeca rosetta]EGD76531.1 hypothetical protein PTSG_07648 [Salpingoeca rosetta]|eukprot:XP_004991445.1 hypothetical protein PTSG_07648 [Salpingoeca rosetta]
MMTAQQQQRMSRQEEAEAVEEAGAEELDPDRSWWEWSRGKPVAFQWHAARRRHAINIAHHEIAPLMGADSRTTLLAMGLAGAQLWLAYRSKRWSWAALIGVSATGGALIAYDLQALCHEMGHHCPEAAPPGSLVGAWSRARYLWQRFWTSKPVSHVVGLCCSALTWGPWYSYYFGHGHHHHHAALDNPAGAVLWASIASVSIPIVYFASLITSVITAPGANTLEVCLASADFSLKVAINAFLMSATTTLTASSVRAGFGLLGTAAKPGVYIALSSAFSMGLLCHPCITFWLLQHTCLNPPPPRAAPLCPEEMEDVVTGALNNTAVFHSPAQPTVSYYGSAIWNWLTLNELLHVEHHDFSRVPWTQLQTLTHILPSMYRGGDMLAVHSLYGDVIWPWICTRGRKLVVGDVNGRFTQLFKKIRVILAKNGNFDALFCVGSFFGEDGSVDDLWKSLQDRSVAVPCPTYIMGPVTDAQIKFYDKDDAMRSFYTDKDVTALVNTCSDRDFKPVDLLLTARWPDTVLSNQAGRISSTAWIVQNPGAAAVARAAAPRYHFAAGQEFFERAPYRNHQQDQAPRPATRFLGLAPVANPAKSKWIYAFSITPAAKEAASKLLAIPDNATTSPYDRSLPPPQQQRQQQHPGRGGPPRPLSSSSQQPPPSSFQPQQQQQQQSFFWSSDAAGGGGRRPRDSSAAKRRDRSSGPPAKRPPVTPASCWFCLGSPKVERHLVVSVAKQAMKTTPYFSVQLPDGAVYLAVITGAFPLQFGREVLCSPALLNTPDRIEWKRCVLGKDEETEQARAYRKRFAEYDPFVKRKD